MRAGETVVKAESQDPPVEADLARLSILGEVFDYFRADDLGIPQ
jgi:hypothetical protein